MHPDVHTFTHYHHQIEDFGAPGGLCSSITKSRHITAVKKPWRQSNRHNALGQMLVTNQRLDKLAAMQSDFISRGMLPAPLTAIATTSQSCRVDAGDNEEGEEEGPCDDKEIGRAHV